MSKKPLPRRDPAEIASELFRSCQWEEAEDVARAAHKAAYYIFHELIERLDAVLDQVIDDMLGPVDVMQSTIPQSARLLRFPNLLESQTATATLEISIMARFTFDSKRLGVLNPY